MTELLFCPVTLDTCLLTITLLSWNASLPDVVNLVYLGIITVLAVQCSHLKYYVSFTV
jgi:hypothetical protein